MRGGRAEQKEKTREHLFAVAMRLFQRRGYDDVNVDDIVRAAKVARGTFYFHFPKKDDVLLEAIRRSEERVVARLEAIVEDAPLRGVLGIATHAFAEDWVARRDLLPHAGAVALRRIAAVEVEREQDPLRPALGRHVGRALAVGELRSGLPAQMLADIFLLNVFAGLMAWAHAGEPDLATVMGAIVELFLQGAEGFGAGAAT
jgi:AcrR family transcriptional regulator